MTSKEKYIYAYKQVRASVQIMMYTKNKTKNWRESYNYFDDNLSSF